VFLAWEHSILLPSRVNLFCFGLVKAFFLRLGFESAKSLNNSFSIVISILVSFLPQKDLESLKYLLNCEDSELIGKGLKELLAADEEFLLEFVFFLALIFRLKVALEKIGALLFWGVALTPKLLSFARCFGLCTIKPFLGLG